MLAMPSFVSSRRVLGFTEQGWVEDLNTKHVLFHAELAAFEGKNPSDHTLSINADGAASHAHTTPKVAGRVPKGMLEWHQQLQGLVFTRACAQCSQRIWWCERKCKYVSHRTFQLLRKGLPRIVKLRMAACIDGSTARRDG